MHLKRSKKFFPLFILSFLVMICMISFESYAEDSISFSGKGTKESPYLITNMPVYKPEAIGLDEGC